MTGNARNYLFGSILLSAIGFSACSDDSDTDGGTGGSDAGGSTNGIGGATKGGATKGGATAVGGSARGGTSGVGASAGTMTAGGNAQGGNAQGGNAQGGNAQGGNAQGGALTGGTLGASGGSGAAAGTRGAGAPGVGGTGTAGVAGGTLGTAGTHVTTGGATAGAAGAPRTTGNAGAAGRLGVGGVSAGAAGLPVITSAAGTAGAAGATSTTFTKLWSFDTVEGWGIKASTVDTPRIDANAGTTLTFGLTPGVATWTVPFIASANSAVAQTALENNFTAVDLTNKTITLKIRWVSGGIGVAAAATGGFDVYVIAADADLTEGASNYVGALALTDRGTAVFKSFTYSVPPAAAPWEPSAVRQLSIRIDSRFWSADPQPVFDYTTAVFEVDSVTY